MSLFSPKVINDVEMNGWITPMGLKIAECDIDNKLITLDRAVEITKGYHKGQYVIGYDKMYCDAPHYHIHWWAPKVVTEGAKKTFRSEKLSMLSRKSKFYLGKDLPSANQYVWLGYAIKENEIDLVNYTEEQKKEIRERALVQREIKMLKAIKSEQIAEVEKEKNDFRFNLLKFVNDNYNIYIKENDIETKHGIHITTVRVLIIRYLRLKEKFGSMKQHIIRSYVLMYLIKYCNYSDEDIDMFLNK